MKILEKVFLKLLGWSTTVMWLCAKSSILYSQTPHCWTQTDWSGEGESIFWVDSTSYYSINNATGKKLPGCLILQKPGLRSWVELIQFPNATGVVCFVQSPTDTFFAGTKNNDGIDIWLSSNKGTTWENGYHFMVGGKSMTDIIYSLCFSEGTLYAAFHTWIDDYEGRIYKILDIGGVGEGLEGLLWCNTSPRHVYSLLVFSDTIIAGAGSNSCILYSTNDGSSWTIIPTSTYDDRIACLLRSSWGTIYAGTGDTNGKILKSQDGGATWTEAADLPNATSIYCLIETPDSILYAGTGPNGIVFKSTDGDNWDTTATILGAKSIFSLVCDSLGNIYAGGSCSDDSARVFTSRDGGNSWAISGVLVGASSVYCLLYTPWEDIFAGTDYNGAVFKTGYAPEGELISSIYNTGTGNRSVKYDTIRWDATYNGQEITVKVRTFNDTVGWSDTIPWSDCPPCTNGQLLSSLSSVRDSMQFIQYRLEFATQDFLISPVFHEINIYYSLDTTGPIIESANAYGDEEFIPPDTIIPKDKIIITFSEPIDTFTIDPSNIDSLLKLSGGHTWLDSSGQITSAVWDSSCKILTITLGKNGWSRWVNVGDTIYPQPYLNDSIADRWGNECVSFCVIEGSFGPCIDSIVAYDGEDSLEYIDNDDYVNLYFSKRTNKPKIDANNIDSILYVPNHTWLDGLGELRGDSCIWDEYGVTLTCSLKIDSLRPTIAMGDTVFPCDSVIWDKFERGYVVFPAIIQGSFGVYGPIIDSAIAYEGDPQEVGIGDGDFVFIYFNKLIKEISWNLVDIDTILTPVANGDTHTWEPERLRCYVQQLERVDLQGIPYTLLYIYFEKPGVEEKEIQITDCKFQNYPTLFPKGTWIEFQIPTKEHMLSRLGSIRHSAIEVGDTIYPNPEIIRDLENRNAKGFAVLQGSFQKSKNGNIGLLAYEKISNVNKQGIKKSEKIESKIKVCIKIYNLGGQLVRTLINKQLRPGKYKIYWDGLDEEKREVKCGIYFCKLEIGEKVFTNKLIKLQ